MCDGVCCVLSLSLTGPGFCLLIGDFTYVLPRSVVDVQVDAMSKRAPFSSLRLLELAFPLFLVFSLGMFMSDLR